MQSAFRFLWDVIENMATLDCESLETTLKSLSIIYGVEIPLIVNFLNQTDLDYELEYFNVIDSCDRYIQKKFENTYGKPKIKISKVAWFHLTRTSSESDFSEGILPLNLALDRIWDTLIYLVDSDVEKDRLNYMRLHGVPDFQYGFKTGDSLHWGPFAMLVRKVAFNAAQVVYHDYLEVPEIIEDICNGYERKYGESIYSKVISGLKKCIVKFYSDKKTANYLLGNALLYCWVEVKNEEFISFANTCFDGNASLIKPENIVAIEFLPVVEAPLS